MAEVKCPLREAAHISQNEKAMVWDDDAITFYELDQTVTGVAQRLQKVGVQPGDRIGLLADTSWQLVAMFLGVLRVGAVACPLSTRFPHRAVLDTLKELNVQVCFVDGSEPLDRERVATYALKDFVKVPDPRLPAVESSKPKLEQDATVVLTSGSSRGSRAVLHTYGNHYYSALGSNANIRVHTKDRWLLSIPLYHVGGIGIVFRCLLSGATLAIPPEGEGIGFSLQTMEATHCSLVATQLLRLLQETRPTTTLPLQAILLGGGPVPASVVREATERGWPTFLSYGLTEMASQVCTESTADVGLTPRTVGPVLRYRELQLAEDGEILVRGRTLCRGYIREGNVAGLVDEEGWFATGDLGAFDAGGRLTVAGRKDNMFISGGENIQPEEIEAFLADVPGVMQCMVLPIEDDEFGHRPVAVIQFEGAGPSDKDLASYLRERLPGFKVPNRFLPWPKDLAKAGLKVSRAEVAKQVT